MERLDLLKLLSEDSRQLKSLKVLIFFALLSFHEIRLKELINFLTENFVRIGLFETKRDELFELLAIQFLIDDHVGRELCASTLEEINHLNLIFF